MQAQKTKNFLQNIKTPFANMIIINEGVVIMEYNKKWGAKGACIQNEFEWYKQFIISKIKLQASP